MTSKDMHDIFKDGTEVELIYGRGYHAAATITGWRENGIVVDTGFDIIFIPLTSLISVSIAKETSHA